MRTPEVEFAVHLDRGASRSLSAQLVLAIRQAIEEGTVRPGDRFPPSRVLASRLGVSRGTVVAAYEQLVAEGYFSSGHGRGTHVNPELAKLHGPKFARTRAERSTPARTGEGTTPTRSARELRTQQMPPADPKSGAEPSASPLDPLSDLAKRPAWRAAWRKAAVSPRLDHAVPIAGDRELLHEIAEHLRTMRGTVRSPEDLLVTAGAREGLSLILTGLGASYGRDLVIGVEESSPFSLPSVAARHGARIVRLPVDNEGLVTGQLPRGVFDVIIVTPSHQYPHGAALPLARRVELVAWARESGVVLVEDDYDTELRYVNAPLPTLAALDDPVDGAVLTLGSYSATLSPGLSAGFLVAPTRLRRLLLAVRDDLGCPVSPILQIALAELLASGEVRRHVARLRRKSRRENTQTM